MTNVRRRWDLEDGRVVVQRDSRGRVNLAGLGRSQDDAWEVTCDEKNGTITLRPIEFAYVLKHPTGFDDPVNSMNVVELPQSEATRQRRSESLRGWRQRQARGTEAET